MAETETVGATRDGTIAVATVGGTTIVDGAMIGAETGLETAEAETTTVAIAVARTVVETTDGAIGILEIRGTIDDVTLGMRIGAATAVAEMAVGHRGLVAETHSATKPETVRLRTRASSWW